MLGKNVVFLTGGLTQPRVIKRIKYFYSRGYNVHVYGFDRGTFQNVNNLPPEIPVECLGYIENGRNYLYSFFLNRRKFVPILRKYEKQDVFFYAFGFFPAFWTALYAIRPFIYEISDLIYGYFRYPIVREVFRRIDRIVIRRSYRTVLTSQGFYNYLFPKQDRRNILVVPNKLDQSFNTMERKCKPIVNDKIRFAFLGFLRYPNTVFRFASIIGQKFPQYSFSFYGDSKYRDEVAELSRKYNNVFFYGKYKNPEDLPQLYDNVDVVVACYDTTTFNERVAEPNKLYESLFFCKPIIVTEKTFLALRVRALECGYEINASTDENIISFLNKITVDSVNRKMHNISKIRTSEMIDDPNYMFSAL